MTRIAPHPRLGLHLGLGIHTQWIHRVVFPIAALGPIPPPIEDQVARKENHRNLGRQFGQPTGHRHILESRRGRIGLTRRTATARCTMDHPARTLADKQPLHRPKICQIYLRPHQRPRPATEPMLTRSWHPRPKPILPVFARAHDRHAGIANEPACARHPHTS